MKTNKLVKALLVLGFGVGLSAAASAGRFSHCNDLLQECRQGDQVSCQRAIDECLA
jgi:hypothetical protein